MAMDEKCFAQGGLELLKAGMIQDQIPLGEAWDIFGGNAKGSGLRVK